MTCMTNCFVWEQPCVKYYFNLMKESLLLITLLNSLFLACHNVNFRIMTLITIHIFQGSCIREKVADVTQLLVCSLQIYQTPAGDQGGGWHHDQHWHHGLHLVSWLQCQGDSDKYHGCWSVTQQLLLTLTTYPRAFIHFSVFYFTALPHLTSDCYLETLRSPS